MSADAQLLGYEFAGRGPAQQRLLEWLGGRVDCPLETSVAQRSPAGAWAIKVHAPNRVPTCAELLRDEPWVETVAVRPQHLYVRMTPEQLCTWVVEGYRGGDPVATVEGAGRSVLVRGVDARTASPRPLRLFREQAVAASLASLLRSRGFEVQLELLPAGGETYDDVWAAAPGSVTHTLVVGDSIPLPTELERGDHVVHVPVGEVDVRHGPLRARNGGSVSADDLVAEVVRALPAHVREQLASDAAEQAYGEAVLALLLIATPRARRIQLDDAALTREANTFACLFAARRWPAEARPADAAIDAEALRRLAAEIDLLPTVAGRGATSLEPALAARSLRSLAEAALPELHGAMPSAAVREAIDAALGLAAIALPPEPASLRAEALAQHEPSRS